MENSHASINKAKSDECNNSFQFNVDTAKELIVTLQQQIRATDKLNGTLARLAMALENGSGGHNPSQLPNSQDELRELMDAKQV